QEWITTPIRPLLEAAERLAPLERGSVLATKAPDAKRSSEQLSAPLGDVVEEVAGELALLGVFTFGIDVDRDHATNEILGDRQRIASDCDECRRVCWPHLADAQDAQHRLSFL